MIKKVQRMNSKNDTYFVGDNNKIEFQISFADKHTADNFVSWWNTNLENYEEPNTDYRNGHTIHLNFGKNKLTACSHDYFALDEFKNAFYQICVNGNSFEVNYDTV